MFIDPTNPRLRNVRHLALVLPLLAVATGCTSGTDSTSEDPREESVSMPSASSTGSTKADPREAAVSSGEVHPSDLWTYLCSFYNNPNALYASPFSTSSYPSFCANVGTTSAGH